MENKVCRGCHTEKPKSEFYKDASKKDGLRWKCRECANKLTASWARKNINHLREYQRNYVKTPKRADSIRAYKNSDNGKRAAKVTSKNSYANGKIKQQAANAVNYAIKTKRLDKWPCEVCGDTNSHGHHVSYDRSMWLSVTWLCISHHAELHLQHRRNGE